ncbi:MAG: citryl-CoA lyase [Patescibacteria group bacterium]
MADEYRLHDMPITQLIAEGDFVSTLWFAWTGVRPDEKTKRILSACLVACVDHGEKPPSAMVARTVASCGKPLADSVAAGLLTLGPRHGNAASAASQWLRDAIARNESAESIVTKSLTDKRRIPGIGHPEYDIDPRAVKLVEIAKSQLTATPHCDLANDVSRVFSERKGKPLPLNVDGAIGALIADLGAPADLADAIFIAARTVGLIAHAREEAEQSESYRR